jgi:hypothetical protein
MIEVPDRASLEAVTDVDIEDFPEFSRVRRHREPDRVNDVETETANALDDVPAIETLPEGAEVAITAGSRGIHDIVPILGTVVDELKRRALNPVILPTMGSHGGATADGQRKLLATLGITEDSMGCEIRSSMDVEQVATDGDGRPIYTSSDALRADAILLVNRIKIHTDFVDGTVESGLCKMAVIGLGKQRGADEAHRAATASSFREVLPEWTPLIVQNTPIVGGLAILENADEETAAVEGVAAERLVEREAELFEQSLELFPTLPVDELDLLVIDEIGKHISGTGMDTNVVGRMLIYGEPEPEDPSITRIYVRSLTERTDGNGLGIGLADFVHRDAVAELNTLDTYINALTGSEPERARVPMVLPSDATALAASHATAGVDSPADTRIAWIRNTMEPEDVLVSAPVADELREREETSVEEVGPLTFDDGDLVHEWS